MRCIYASSSRRACDTAAATGPTMAPSPSPAMVIARAEQGTLGALAVPRVTVGKNPFVKSQAGTYDSIIVIVPGTCFFSRRRNCICMLEKVRKYWLTCGRRANRARVGNNTDRARGREVPAQTYPCSSVLLQECSPLMFEAALTAVPHAHVSTKYSMG